MSLGRRTNGSASPSAWRSMSMSKKRAPPSVSFVFAEPEQGAPLESAAAQLPPAAYNNDNIMRKRDRLESTSTLRDDDKDSASLSAASIKRLRVGASVDSLQSPQDATNSAPDVYHTAQWEGLLTETPKPTSPDVALVPTQTLSIPFPTTQSTKSNTTPKPSPSGSSWFGPLSRPKTKDSMPKVISLDEDPNKDDTPGGGQAVPADASISQAPAEPKPTAAAAPDPDPPHPPPPRIPAPNQAHRGWFSPSPSSPTPPTSRPSVSPIAPSSPNSHSHSNSVASIPSSLDEEVPKLSVLTPPNTPGPVNVMQNAGGGSSKLSSLNPSTGRFTLSIPLLGRPKIPLDQAVAVVAAGDGQKGKSEPTVQGQETEPEQATQIDETTTIPTPTPQMAAAASTEQQAPLKPADDQIGDTSSASWWGYVGWNKSDTLPVLETSSLSKPTSQPSPSSSDAPTIRAVKSDPQLPVSAMAPEPQVDASLKGNDPKSTGDTLLAPTNTALNVKDKAQSVFSAGTTQTQGSATWYVPWTWYERSPANPGGEAVGSQGSEADGKTVMTQSEMVKEEALARDRDPVDTVPNIEITAPSSMVSPAPEQRNPIESTVSSNKSGWASFFSSKSLAVKNITDGKDRDESGMEVMDIDEDEGSPDPNAVSSTASAPLLTDEKKLKEMERQVPGTQLQTKIKPRPEPKASEKLKLERPKDDKPKPPALPLTNSDAIKRDKPKEAQRTASPTPSAKSGNKSPGSPRNPNLVLPTWTDTFHTAPRSLVPPQPSSAITKTFDFVSGVLFPGDKERIMKGKAKAKDKEFSSFGKELPKAFDVLGKRLEPDVLRGCSKAVIIGVHGWFPGAVMRTVLGDPTGTSGKFVDMMLQALDEFQDKHNVKLKTITKIPLEGEGTINKRVDKLYHNLLANTTWMNEIHAADVIFIATHSQGSVVSTHLLDRLIRDGHIRTRYNMKAAAPIESLASSSTDIVPIMQPQKICCLALCGIHLGPLRYLSTSSLLQPYFQYFESAAARELFEFQDTKSEVSKQYALALTNVMHHGTKMVYIASLNDQVVPLYSGLFITATHPLILRALYIDGDAYQSSDFLSNLLVLLLRVLNSGISDSGLLTHLSEATAGSLNGVGHSTVYEELATYSLAVDYCFLANDGLDIHPELVVDSFDAKTEQNDYEIPWALRDVIADERVAHFFSNEIVQLRDAFREWLPKTTILRDIKKKLQPIQRLPSSILKDSVSRL